MGLFISDVGVDALLLATLGEELPSRVSPMAPVTSADDEMLILRAFFATSTPGVLSVTVTTCSVN